VQNAVAALGYPAPRVLVTGDMREALGGAFIVMERLPGRPLFDTLDPESSIVLRSLRSLPYLMRRLPVLLASLHVRLHALEQGRILAALREAGTPDLPTVGVRLEELHHRIAAGRFAGLAPGLTWLVQQQPTSRGHDVLCHGDIWPGNVLGVGGRVTAVLDWSAPLVTLADPAYDVGNTLAGLEFGEGGYPRAVRAMARAVQRHIARRFHAACVVSERFEPDDVRYYVLLRCFSNCCWVAERRAGLPWRRLDSAPNVWSLAKSIDAFAGHFRARTGIALHLDAEPVPSSAPASLIGSAASPPPRTPPSPRS
jgi:aminoglycoside phosphotransferase (APT) family kinase protein